MPVIVGIDEAGYGPSLGPLVITAAAFEVATTSDTPQDAGTDRGCGVSSLNLWHILQGAVSDPLTHRGKDDRRIIVGDSKKLYSTKKGLRNLEEAVLAFHACPGGKVFTGLKDLLHSLHCCDERHLNIYPWHRSKDLRLPLVSSGGDITDKYIKLKDILSSGGVKYLTARSAVISPDEFNRRVADTGNKSLLLFDKCANLISGMWAEYPEVEIFCGKHGGRNRYGAMLSEAFGRHSEVKTISEDGSSSSCYEINDNARRRRMRITFLKDAEDAHLPVALASMYCKYIRELFLKLFNDFWQEHLPGLRPTAGYPVDARRFLRDIGELKARLGISDDILVRSR